MGKAQEVNAEELARFVAMMEARAVELTGAAEAARARVKELHVKKFEGADVAVDLAAARESLNDLDVEAEAAAEVLETKRALLVDAVPAALLRRIEDLKGQWEALEVERQAGHKHFLDCVAVAMVARERVKGVPLHHMGNGNYIQSMGSLEVKLALLPVDDMNYLSAAVDKARGSGKQEAKPGIESRLGFIVKKFHDLETILGDPAAIQTEATAMVAQASKDTAGAAQAGG
ncbi:MAG: hypothetical protein KKA60_14760 [Proteobacteria bacterium]|nr:hypothetical protein [Pseudomonadota bacterium]